MTTDLQNDPNAIKTVVRDYYGQRIQQAGASCCGGGAELTEVQLYGAEELTQLHEDVNTTSFGCGNPIALASLQPGEVVLDLGSGGGLDVLIGDAGNDSFGGQARRCGRLRLWRRHDRRDAYCGAP